MDASNTSTHNQKIVPDSENEQEKIDNTKSDLTNALKYCESLLHDMDLLTKSPPSVISANSIAIGECESSEEDYEEQFSQAPVTYIPLWYKEKAVAFAAAHPKWGLRRLQSHGFALLKYKRTLYRWKEDVKNGGNRFDKWKMIDHETYERFTEARKNFEQITTRTLQQWAMGAALPFLCDDFQFMASRTWVRNFKYHHKIRQRKITKYISSAGSISIQELLEAGKRFQNQTKHLITKFEPNFVINTDQSGCEYQATYKRSLFEKGSETVIVKTKSLNKLTHSYTVQYAITASGKLLPLVFLCMQEPTAKFGPQIQSNVDELFS